MNWKKWTIIIFIAFFVAVNFYLIFKKDSEIARSKYIDEWRLVQRQNLVLTTERAGVVTPAQEEYVYFQHGAGEFEQFFVKKGDEVSSGTPLFSYSPRDFEAAIEQFEAEIKRLQLEQEALEDNISSLESIEMSLSTAVKDEEENFTSQATVSNIEAQIYEKELHLSRIEAEIDKYEELISNSRNHLGTLTVESPISGTVKEISHELQNPVVTIISSDQHVKGILEEEDLLEIEEGMEVIVTGSFGKKDGVIAKVASTPEADPKVGAKSEYEYIVEFEEGLDEESENDEEASTEENGKEGEVEEDDSEQAIYTGSHVSVKMIKKEVEDALTLPNETNRLGNIYVLKGDGTIEKRQVQTGIKVNGVYEITSEAEEGELVIYEPTNIRNNTTFFTPIEFSEMRKGDLKKLGKKEIFKSVGRGLLSR